MKYKFKNHFFNDTTEIPQNYKTIILLTHFAISRQKGELVEFLKILKQNNYSSSKQYEVLLQIYLFGGFPVSLESLKIFNEVSPRQRRVSKKIDYEKFVANGKRNCYKVYGENTQKLISNVEEFSPELSEWLISEGYGKVFSRTGLSFLEREIVAITSLSYLQFSEQLFSHINGAYRNGFSIDTLSKIIMYIAGINNTKRGNFIIQVFESFKLRKGLTK